MKIALKLFFRANTTAPGCTTAPLPAVVKAPLQRNTRAFAVQAPKPRATILVIHGANILLLGRIISGPRVMAGGRQRPAAFPVPNSLRKRAPVPGENGGGRRASQDDHERLGLRWLGGIALVPSAAYLRHTPNAGLRAGRITSVSIAYPADCINTTPCTIWRCWKKDQGARSSGTSKQLATCGLCSGLPTWPRGHRYPFDTLT